MTFVTPYENESAESMLKRFTKKVIAAGILQEYRARQEYVKPSEKIRKDKAAARSRIRKLRRKQEMQIDFDNNNKFRPRKPNNQQQHRPNRDAPPASAPKKAPPTPPTPAPISKESLRDLQQKFQK